MTPFDLIVWAFAAALSIIAVGVGVAGAVGAVVSVVKDKGGRR